ncbi:MAG: nitrilase-related carbon-nitrogen hydrolase [Rhodothermales bacterium]
MIVDAAVIQFEPAHGDRATCLGRARALIEETRADLIVLPELFSTGYFFRHASELEGLAEELPEGHAASEIRKWSRDLHAVIVAGIAENSKGKLFNSALVAMPDGTSHVYRKVHLYYREKDVFHAGDQGFPVIEIPIGDGQSYQLGVMICFDWYFPESARSLALQGADVIAHPSNLVRRDCPRAMPIRALENHVYTLTANRTGCEENGGEELHFIGQSVICDPMGNVIASAGRDDATVLYAAIDIEAARDRGITAYNDVLGDRRPDQYTLR